MNTSIRIRYGLRTLLLSTICAAIVAAVICEKVSIAYRERRAISKLRTLEALIVYGEANQTPHNPITFGQGNAERLENRLTPDSGVARQVYFLSFLSRYSNTIYIGVDDLAVLQSLPELDTLVLSGTNVTDSHLRHIVDLPNLRDLRLCRTQVSDSGVGLLRKTQRLTRLSLSGTAITDDGLKHLKSLRRLRELDLSNTGVTDLGMQYVSCALELQVLNLSGTNITDSGVAQLRRLKELRHLDVSYTKLTERAVTYLREFDQLHELMMSGVSVNNTAFDRLTQMTTLTFVRHDETFWYRPSKSER